MHNNNNRPERVAVDAMGGDYAPHEPVNGAIKALQDNPGLEISLVGDQAEVEAELTRYDTSGLAINVVASSGKIGDDEHPLRALRHKPDASIIVATKLVKSGNSDALVSMGSTGASMASSAMILGLMDGLDRPCIGGPFLGLSPNTVVVDMGSNVDCRPPLLVNFGVMGAVFAQKYLGIENPRVGLLSVGSEEAKGNRQVQESYRLFQESPLNFVGNVEGTDFFTDRADVIVCDGFVGNILMKFTEGLGSALVPYLKNQLSTLLPAPDVMKIITDLWQLTNLPRTMGGPLLGVNGAVILGHGSSKADGIAGAINTARQFVVTGIIDSMRQELAEIKPKAEQRV